MAFAAPDPVRGPLFSRGRRSTRPSPDAARRPQRARSCRRSAQATRGTILTATDDTTAATGPTENGFAALGALPETVQALEAMGITQPFAIQTMTLPIALGGHDLIGQARTGTGKTLGFGVPLLQRITSVDECGPAGRADDDVDPAPQ